MKEKVVNLSEHAKKLELERRRSSREKALVEASNFAFAVCVFMPIMYYALKNNKGSHLLITTLISGITVAVLLSTDQRKKIADRFAKVANKIAAKVDISPVTTKNALGVVATGLIAGSMGLVTPMLLDKPLRIITEKVESDNAARALHLESMRANEVVVTKKPDGSVAIGCFNKNAKKRIEGLPDGETRAELVGKPFVVHCVP